MTSQVYRARRRGKAALAPRAPQAKGPSLEQLRGGAMPTAEQLGHKVDLPQAIRGKMEASFGADLGGVELYESQTVAQAGAQAMTMGNKIGFAPGALDFASSAGQALLGHELSHVVSQARGEVAGRGFLNNQALEARADREGAMAAAGENVYSGPVTPISTASTALSAAGPMQAKKPKEKKAEKALAYMTSDGRSQEVDQYFAGKFGDAQNRGAMSNSHMFRLFSRQSYGKSQEEKDDLYDMYTNADRRGEYLAHVQGLVNQTMNMDMDAFKLEKEKDLLKGGQRVHDVTTDLLALSDVVKDNQKDLGYSDSFVKEQFGARREYMINAKNDVRGRLREIVGQAEKGSTAASPRNQLAFGETGQNQGFEDFKTRFLEGNRKKALSDVAEQYNAVSMSQYEAATPEQRAAAKDYIRDSRDMNGLLRGNVEIPQEQRAELEEKIEQVSSMMQTTESDQTGYRAISDAALLPLLAQSGMEDVIKANGTIDHEALLREKDRMIGLTFQDKGFVSTTAASQFAEKWGEGIGRRDLNFFKQRALERRGITQEERERKENKPLLEDLEGERGKKMSVANRQQYYGALADNLLKGDEAIKESDIGSHTMEIALPKGSKAAYIDSASTISGKLGENTLPHQQMEILLNRGSRFRISDILPKLDEHGKSLPNQFRIIMELLQEEEEQGGTSEVSAPPAETAGQSLDVDSMSPAEKKKYMIQKLNGMRG